MHKQVHCPLPLGRWFSKVNSRSAEAFSTPRAPAATDSHFCIFKIQLQKCCLVDGLQLALRRRALSLTLGRNFMSSFCECLPLITIRCVFFMKIPVVAGNLVMQILVFLLLYPIAESRRSHFLLEFFCSQLMQRSETQIGSIS